MDVQRVFVTVLVASLTFFSAVKSQGVDDGLTVKANTEITVESFDASTQTYVFKINAEPAVGPNIAPKSNLHEALGLDPQQLSAVQKDASKLFGRVLVLKKPVRLIDVDDYEDMKKPKKPQKHQKPKKSE